MNTEELELTKKAVELLNDRNLKDLKDRNIIFNLAIIFNDRERYYEEYKELFMKYLCIANF